MYVLFVQHKLSKCILVPFCRMFTNKHLFRINIPFLKKYPPKYYYYYLCYVLPSRNIFDKHIFLHHYKYYYIKAYKVEPHLFPIKFVSENPNTHKNRNAYSFEYSLPLLRYLQDDKEFFSKANCVVFVRDTVDQALDDEMNIARIQKSAFEKNDSFYICSKKHNNREIVLSVKTDLYNAIGFITSSIVKSHEFLINDDSVHFVNQYSIYKVDSSHLSSFVYQIDWYEHIIYLSYLMNKQIIEKDNKWYVHAIYDLFTIHKDDIPPIFQDEMLRIRRVFSIKMQDIFMDFKRGSSNIQYTDAVEISDS